MSKVQIGPRIEKALYEAFVDKIGGKEHVNKTVNELIDQFVNMPQEEVQLTTQPRITKDQVAYPKGTLTPDHFESHLDYVDYLERHGLIY